MQEPVEVLGRVLAASIDYARAGEKLAGSLVTLRHLTESLAGLVDLDAALAPEITAALDGVLATNGALERANLYLNARLDALLTQARDDVGIGPQPEGDPE